MELFFTARAASRHPDLIEAAAAVGARTSLVTERAAAGLSETRTPQGLVAVCRAQLVPSPQALHRARLVVVLIGVSDPGNAGTVVRVADAAGAAAVLFAGQAVDPYNGKCLRASAGSMFHLALAAERDPVRAVTSCRDAGLVVRAADGGAGRDLDDALDDGTLEAPTAWLFGSEAHGLAPELLAAADDVISVPLHGRAESLNLATAAAVCLYGSARVQRRRSVHTSSEWVN